MSQPKLEDLLDNMETLAQSLEDMGQLCGLVLKDDNAHALPSLVRVLQYHCENLAEFARACTPEQSEWWENKA